MATKKPPTSPQRGSVVVSNPAGVVRRTEVIAGVHAPKMPVLPKTTKGKPGTNGK